jgi:cold shock protein
MRQMRGPDGGRSMAVSGERVQGRVKWFNVNGGFGFIGGPDGSKIFVHYTAVGAPGPSFLREGETVEFTIFEGLEGLQASDVRRVA